jgi:hypothetical protein
LGGTELLERRLEVVRDGNPHEIIGDIRDQVEHMLESLADRNSILVSNPLIEHAEDCERINVNELSGLDFGEVDAMLS